MLRQEIKHPLTLNTIKKHVVRYLGLARTDYSVGLGTLDDYEMQTLKVLRFKIHGLRKHHSFWNKKKVEFFYIHQKTESLAKRIDRLSERDQEKVLYRALRRSGLLWTLFDRMAEYYAH